MKIPSRAKLEKDLARLKRAAQVRSGLQADTSNPGNNASFSPDLMTKIEIAFGRVTDFLGKIPSFFPEKIAVTEPPPLLLENHDLTRMIQVVSEEPKFFHWFIYLRSMPLEKRTGELQRMADAMRIDPDNKDLAGMLDHLQSPTIYESFCQVLQNEKNLNQV